MCQERLDRSWRDAQERPPASLSSLAALLVCAGTLYSLPVAAYVQTNLVSDIPGLGLITDPNLVNPWGMAYSATSPFWVSDNGTGLSTLYNGAGTPQALVVTIPPAPGGSGPSKPTGQVFNGGSGFNADRFIFATEDGTISGWRGALGTNAELLVDNSPGGAIYKGLAIGSNASGDFIYAANFHANSIDVFNSTFAPTNLSGLFLDPNLPAGYAPFNIQNLGGSLYVAYAQQDANAEDEIAGPGAGFVDVFDTDGVFLRRLISNGALDAPWGLALAPADFGLYSDDLLVGNFGDGLINAFDPLSGNFLGTLNGPGGTPISIDGLWALGFGNGSNANQLFFTAGLNDEANGLFGKLSVPEPSTIFLLGLGLVALSMPFGRSLRTSPAAALV